MFDITNKIVYIIALLRCCQKQCSPVAHATEAFKDLLDTRVAHAASGRVSLHASEHTDVKVALHTLLIARHGWCYRSCSPRDRAVVPTSSYNPKASSGLHDLNINDTNQYRQHVLDRDSRL